MTSGNFISEKDVEPVKLAIPGEIYHCANFQGIGT